MASVELTLDQILDAVRQLPQPQRQRLLQEIGKLPSAEAARAAAKKLRGTYRMEKRDRKRISELLTKGNAGALTPVESEELNRLVDDFETRTLEMARAISKAGNGSESVEYHARRPRHAAPRSVPAENQRLPFFPSFPFFPP
jgi:hypothetical protein